MKLPPAKEGVIDASFNCLDLVSGVFFLFLIFLFAAVHLQIEQMWRAGFELIAAFIVWFSGTWVIRRRLSQVSWMIRPASVLAAYGILFSVAEKMQHVFVPGWMDDRIVALDAWLLGSESSLLLQKFIHPLLTEWMMFAYVMYVPLLPLVAIICYRSKNGSALNDYLLNLAVSYCVCYVGFMMFPVATQMHYLSQLYTVPLDGWLFTWCGEWMRANLHAPGGGLPSAHCAAATVMLVTLLQHNKRAFFAILPIIITLYVSTTYGRYHYMWDGITGILTGLTVILVSPLCVRAVSWWFPRCISTQNS